MCTRKIEAPTFFNFGKAFSELRKQTPWLQDKSSHIVRHSLNYLAEAYKAFLQGDAGYPRWKSRYGTPSFTIPYDVKIKDDKLYVQKVGWLAIRRKGGNPYPDGEPVQVVVRRVARRWYATVCYKVALTQPADDGKAVGVDMNVRQIADSTGEIYRSPDLAVLEARPATSAAWRGSARVVADARNNAGVQRGLREGWPMRGRTGNIM